MVGGIAADNGRAPATGRWLGLCAAASLALLVLPIGLSSSTGCSDTGGSMHLEGTWLLSLAFLIPTILVVGAAYAGAGLAGAEPWWRAAATVTLLAAGSFVEIVAGMFAIFEMCERASLMWAYVHVGVAAAVPVLGALAARLSRTR